jgi:hypothetical protein
VAGAFDSRFFAFMTQSSHPHSEHGSLLVKAECGAGGEMGLVFAAG